MTVGEAVRGSRQFWMLITALFLAGAAINGVLAHIVALLTDRGIAAATATAALSAAGLALIIGRVVAGYCLDRFHGPYIATFFFACPLAGIALLLTGAGGWAPLICTVLFGLGIGAEIDLMAFLIGRYFGLRAFATIYGVIFATFTVASGIGPYCMGRSYDLTRSYNPALTGFVVALLGACLLMARLGSYRFPARG